MTIDLFLNPWAGSYRNRWYWDGLLNRLEAVEWFPEKLSRKLRGARKEDYLFEKASRSRDKYGKIMRNRGFSHITITLPEFQRALAQSIRERPSEPKIICSGDGGVKEALTTAINYVDAHNALEKKVAETFNHLVLKGRNLLNAEVGVFLCEFAPVSRPSRSHLVPLAHLVLEQKEIGFSFLESILRLSEEEKKFIRDYDLKITDLLKGKLPYPSFGFVQGGTFNVFAHNFRLDGGARYLQQVLRQEEEGFVQKCPFQPLQVNYKTERGKEKKLYGSIYGHGIIRDFFDLYYEGRVRPGPMKAAYLSLFYRYLNQKEYQRITAPSFYSYEVKENEKSPLHFEQQSTLCAASVIGRLPFQMKYFHPRPGSMHAGATKQKVAALVKKSLLSIPLFARMGSYLGISDRYQIEQDFPAAKEMVIRPADEKGLVKFVLDGDRKDEENLLYDAKEVKLSMGPMIEVINPGKRR